MRTFNRLYLLICLHFCLGCEDNTPSPTQLSNDMNQEAFDISVSDQLQGSQDQEVPMQSDLYIDLYDAHPMSDYSISLSDMSIVIDSDVEIDSTMFSDLGTTITDMDTTVIDIDATVIERDVLGQCAEGFSAVRTIDLPCWSSNEACIHENLTCEADANAYHCPETNSCWATAECAPCELAHCERCLTTTTCRLCDQGYIRAETGECVIDPSRIDCTDDDGEFIQLNVRVHIMRDDNDWLHATGARLNNDHITREDVVDVIIPEVNRIWAEAKIRWHIESVIDEMVVRTESYNEDVAYVMAAGRDENGRSDPARLPCLNRMMDERYRSTAQQIATNVNLFHVYLFPFIGNTGQGNAMRSYQFSTVNSTWSNKRKRQTSPTDYCTPQRRPLIESWDDFQVGSVAQTIAHEVGHVLGLNHDNCEATNGCLMKSNGYVFNHDQICTSRQLASQRTPLSY